MAEVELFYDRELTRPVGETLDFGVVPAGKKSLIPIFARNALDWVVNVRLTLSADDVKIVKDLKAIPKGDFREVVFEISPKVTRMTPITGSLSMIMEYVVR